MSSEQGARKQSRRSAEQVAKQTILDNADFVFADPEIMRALLAPADAATGTTRQVVDLRAALIERLERRLARLQEAHRDIIDAAWDSLINLEHVHQAALDVLDAGSLDALAAAARGALPEALEVEHGRLCFERGAWPDGLEAPDARALADGFIGQRLVGPSLIDGRVFLSSVGPTSAPGVDSAVFELDAEGVRSAGYLLLGGDGPAARAALAFGSSDPERFAAGRNADLLKFLGSVVERRLRQLEGLPAAAAAAGGAR